MFCFGSIQGYDVATASDMVDEHALKSKSLHHAVRALSPGCRNGT